MSLSNELISQFVKATKDTRKTSTESTAYGTVVEYNGKTYVKLDGSDLLTPVNKTTDVKNDERVTVMIKDHTATITGNISSPSARTDDVKEVANQISEFEIIIAHKVSVEELEATYATIENLRTHLANVDELHAVFADIESLEAKFANVEYLTATDIEAISANIEKIESHFGTFTDLTTEELEALNADIGILKGHTADFTYVSAEVLEAMKADISDLSAKKLSATEAEIKYANIDFGNIGEAAIKHLFADYGLIRDIIVSNGTITGELVGVTIKGDLIEAGTLKADKLVVKGSDGLYYKLNIEAGAVESAEVTKKELQNGLHGTAIIAKTITAGKIAVDDLVAFDATIGGFNITNSAIYSGAKESATNTTRGVYMDREGQLSVGDSDNYLRYYRTEDSQYVLEIAAGSIVLGASNRNVEDAITDAESIANNASESAASANTRITAAESIIQQLSNCISMLVTDANGGSLMTQTPDGGWTFSMAETSAAVSSLTGLVDALQNQTSDTQATVNVLQQAINDHGLTLEYVNVTTYEDEPCIELGESDSDFKLMITNTRIMFRHGSSTPTYINTNGLVTQNIEVQGEIVQGGYVMLNTSDGGWGLLWKGVST